MVSRRLCRAWMMAVALWCLAASAWAAPTLTAMTFTDLGADRLDIGLRFVGGVPEIRGYRTDAPPRLALDLLDARSGLARSHFAVDSGGVRAVRVVETESRTRLVFELDSPDDYRLEHRDHRVILHLGGASDVATPADNTGSSSMVSEPRITSIDFRRDSEGTGQLLLDLNRPGVAARISGQGRQVTLTLPGVALPDEQYQTLDVSDFDTPIQRIVPRRSATGTQFDITASSDVEPLVTQNGRTFNVAFAPAGSIERSEAGREDNYTGHRITLDFQDIPVRDVLSIIAKEAGLNVVASDSVQGNVTLDLTAVPWDQALDLVLRNHGLSAKREGNVMMVAPTSELANLQRQTLETREQSRQLAPLTTEYVQIRYAKAQELATLLRGDGGIGLMSERGRVIVDPRTNTLILQDTRDRIESIRRAIDHLDVPVRQVQIEARIVIARDSVTRELGVNWGLSSPAGRYLDLDGAANGDASSVPTTADDPASYGGGLAVDLGNATNPASAFSFGYLSSDVLIDLELRALESEGKSQTISQPRVITANQHMAAIKQGQEVPYQEASSSGATTTEFKEAVLSLEVTPQITPDDRIVMDLRVNNDDISDNRFDGAPAIDTNEIQTQVLVDNGETVVLGGILTSEQLHTLFKTPLLGDLPVIGNLFRYTQESNEKVELLVFITPKIIEDGLAIR